MKLLDARLLLLVAHRRVAKYREQLSGFLKKDLPHLRFLFGRKSNLLVEGGEMSVGKRVGRRQHLVAGRHGPAVLRGEDEWRYRYSDEYKKEGCAFHEESREFEETEPRVFTLAMLGLSRYDVCHKRRQILLGLNSRNPSKSK